MEVTQQLSITNFYTPNGPLQNKFHGRFKIVGWISNGTESSIMWSWNVAISSSIVGSLLRKKQMNTKRNGLMAQEDIAM